MSKVGEQQGGSKEAGAKIDKYFHFRRMAKSVLWNSTKTKRTTLNLDLKKPVWKYLNLEFKNWYAQMNICSPYSDFVFMQTINFVQHLHPLLVKCNLSTIIICIRCVCAICATFAFQSLSTWVPLDLILAIFIFSTFLVKCNSPTTIKCIRYL